MTTLRVIVDQIVAPIPGGIGRYTEELTRELIRTAPRGCDVAGIVSSSPEADYELIEMVLPGLDGLFKSALARRELELAWQHGFTRLPGSGMVHATGLFAPLFKHDRVNTVGETSISTPPSRGRSASTAWRPARARTRNRDFSQGWTC